MVEHDQIVTAEAHRDRLTALGERRAVQIECVDQQRLHRGARATGGSRRGRSGSRSRRSYVPRSLKLTGDPDDGKFGPF